MVESDLGDIIYVLAIVVFGIIGALGRNKKKKESGFPQSESKPSFWEELTREMRGGNLVEEQEDYDDEPEFVADRSKPIVSSPLERMDSYSYSEDRLKNESVEYSMKKGAKDKDSVMRKSHKKKKMLLLNLHSIDELKKGIVYAEIFNRKYS